MPETLSKSIVALLLALCAALAAAKDAAPAGRRPGARGAHDAHHRRAALPGLPEPDDRRLERRPRGRPAARRSARCCARARATREIIAYMTARYGDFVLYRPPLKATTALLWFGPAAMLLLGGDGAAAGAAPARPGWPPTPSSPTRTTRPSARRSDAGAAADSGRRDGPAMSGDADFLAEARGRLQQLKSLHDAGRLDASTYDAERRAVEQEIGAHLLAQPPAPPRPRPSRAAGRRPDRRSSPSSPSPATWRPARRRSSPAAAARRRRITPPAAGPMRPATTPPRPARSRSRRWSTSSPPA